jgi:hypothetical protein
VCVCREGLVRMWYSIIECLPATYVRLVYDTQTQHTNTQTHAQTDKDTDTAAESLARTRTLIG